MSYLSASQKIAQYKGWIAEYRKRIAAHKLKYKGDERAFRVQICTRKIKSWKQSIKYLSKKTNDLKNTQRLIAGANNYFGIEIAYDGSQKNKLPRIFLAKFLVENGYSGADAAHVLKISMDTLSKTRKRYTPDNSKDYIRFKREMANINLK
jgi:hypothetical protein